MAMSNPFSKKYVVQASYKGKNWSNIGELVFIPDEMPSEYAEKIRKHNYNMYRVVDKRNGNVLSQVHLNNDMALI